MTGAEILTLFRSGMPEPNNTADNKDTEWCYGIAGIAETLNCCRTTAQQIKNTGFIDAALYTAGRKIQVDKVKLLEVYKENEIRIKTKIKKQKAQKK